MIKMNNSKQIKYGEHDIQSFFQSKEEVEKVFLSWLSNFFENFQLFCFDELSEHQKETFFHTVFTLRGSNSLTPSTVSNFELNRHEIIINRGMIKFLTMINSIFHSVTEVSSQELNSQFIQLSSNLLDTFCLLFDKYEEFPFADINISLNNNGIRHRFEKENNPFEEIVKEVCNHQLEFILLHEIAHTFYPNYSEQQCDEFAIYNSRKIWNSGKSHHTYWCEYSQLVLFLVFELYEIHFQAHEFWVELLNKKNQNINRIKYYSYTHPNSFERFENIVNSLKSISNFTKFQFSFLTSFCNYYYGVLTTNEFSYLMFLNICSIDRQNRDKIFLTNFATVNSFPKWKIDELRNYKVKPIDTDFEELENKNLLVPPFIRFFNERLKIEKEERTKYYYKFIDILESKHGKFSDNVYELELKNSLLMIRNRSWKDNEFTT